MIVSSVYLFGDYADEYAYPAYVWARYGVQQLIGSYAEAA